MSDENQPASNEPTIDVRQGGAGHSFQTPRPASVERSGGIMATATRVGGHALVGEPTGRDLVTVRGQTMQLDTAARMGFVKRTEDGKFVDFNATETAERAAADAEANAPIAEDDTHALELASENAEALTDISRSLEAIGQNPVGVIGSFLAKPTELPEPIKVIAAKAGMDEATALTHMRAQGAAVEEAIGDYLVTRTGVLTAEQLMPFWAWAISTVGFNKIAPAAMQAAYLKDARPFRDWAMQYRREFGARGDAGPTEMRTVGDRKVETAKVRGVTTTAENARRHGRLFIR